MEIDNILTDETVLLELGERLSKRRLLLGLKQTELANKSGVSRSTVERVENGHSVQLTNLIRLLRGLEMISRLDLLIPASQTSPIELLKYKGKERKRASSKSNLLLLSPSENKGRPFTWGDSKSDGEDQS
ncbi:MAG: helix-turn-helix transcriptional regulator [Rhodospirillales bacterium]|jgi:transcriptional regulator with XRE-family HTH domain|nr:helix-turn-helix transcriptional regulator [Rhodospirillales bacterium]